MHTSNMVEPYYKSLCNSVFKTEKGLCPFVCSFINAACMSWSYYITPLFLYRVYTQNKLHNVFFLHHLASSQSLLSSATSVPLIKVHLFTEVSKAKATFLKTALGSGECEPARLRATVNNADALHPHLLHTTYQMREVSGVDWKTLRQRTSWVGN